jgi:hypothetical protein
MIPSSSARSFALSLSSVAPFAWEPSPTSCASSSNSGVVQMSFAARSTISLKYWAPFLNPDKSSNL